jgi:hypothetical protein
MLTLDEIIESQKDIFPSPIRSICETLKFIQTNLVREKKWVTKEREKRRIYRRMRQNKRMRKCV